MPKAETNTLDEAIEKIQQKIADAEPIQTIKSDIEALQEEIKGSEEGQSRLKELEGALETVQQQADEVANDVKRRIAAAERAAFGAGGRYHGVFASDDQARAFGLGVMALGGFSCRKRALEALRSEFPDTAKAWQMQERDPFGSSDADPAIPEGFIAQLIRLVEEHGVFERETMVVPVTTSKTRFPKRTGGVEAKPVDEMEEPDEGKPALTERALEPDKWGVLSYFSREAEEDSAIGIAELFATEMAHGFAVAVDKAGFVGDGTATYSGITGIVNAIGDAAVVEASGDSWGDIAEEDLDQMIGALPLYAQRRAAWHTTNAFFWQVMNKFIRNKGGVTMGEFQGRRMLQYQGFPVVINQVMPKQSASSQIPLVFGDVRMASMMGARRSFEIRRSEHYRITEDIITMVAWRRFDILVHSAGDDSDLVEALVALETTDGN